MKYLLGAALALIILSQSVPAIGADSSPVSRGTVGVEFSDDSQSGVSKLEGEIEWTLKGDAYTLFARYGNDWPFPHQDKEPRLMKRYIELDLGDCGVRAGDFSIVIGRGIALSAKEDRPLGRDSMLDGILWDYGGGAWEATFFYGLHKSGTVNDFPTGVNTVGDSDRQWGGRIAYDFGDFDVGGHYVNSYIADDYETYNDVFMGFDAAFNLLDWRFLYEHDFRDAYRAFEDGRANYAEVSGGWPGIGVTLQYKDYWKMEHPYGEFPRLRRGDLEEASINPNDEKGYMATVIYNPDFLGDSYFTTIFAASEDTERLKPFHEFYIEYQHDPLKDTTYSLGYDYVKGALQTYNYLPAQYRDYIFELDHALSDGSVHLHLRLTEIDGDVGDEEEKEAGIDYNIGGDLTLSLFYETSTKEYEPPSLGGDAVPGESPGEWLAFQAMYDVDKDTSLELMWGAKRGGYECTGGTCALLPPFKGVQVILRRDF